MVPCENERCPPSRRTGSNQLKVPKEADLKASAGKGMVSEIGKEVSCAKAKEEARREVERKEARRRTQKACSQSRWIATGTGWSLHSSSTLSSLFSQSSSFLLGSSLELSERELIFNFTSSFTSSDIFLSLLIMRIIFRLFVD